MIYNSFQNLNLSMLGFGTMRLPTKEDHSIDEEKTAEMVDYAMKNGVNYFDTAFPYHAGMSERVIGKLLAKYPRDSFYLASKYPGHQIAESYDPAAIFEEQLKKCGVEYFDFYLLHNVYEKSIDVYTDPKWGIVDYFLEQKKRGRIRHLGFSSHGRPDNLEAFLKLYGEKMEFCQIQFNYLDWTLQEAKEKYALLERYGIPVWVMEPVRGGRLAKLDPNAEAKMKAMRPDESVAAWAFRWQQRFPAVTVVLSGMTSLEQMKDNIKTFETRKPLTDAENDYILSVAESMKNSLPCTACRYCCDGCPAGLDIPLILHTYNDVRFGVEGSLTAAMQMQALPEDKRPSACVGCGACAATCPQKIDVPAAMKEFSEALATKLPDWNAICRQRAEEAKRNRS